LYVVDYHGLRRISKQGKMFTIGKKGTHGIDGLVCNAQFKCDSIAITEDFLYFQDDNIIKKLSI